MARIHIDIPPTFSFLYTTEIPVRVTDINYGGHLGNDQVLSLIHEARIQFYRHLGFKNELSFEGTIGQIITDAALVYKSEAFLGDVLVCQVAVADFSKYGFDMLYLLTNKATGKEVARAKTGIICFDYEKRKVAAIPEVLLRKVQRS
ncbi:MAG: thioesterase family protein [Bacteroidota bacterium]